MHPLFSENVNSKGCLKYLFVLLKNDIGLVTIKFFRLYV